MEKFCAKYPEMAVCQKLNGFPGMNCDTGQFSCTGDGVQCAIAHLAWKQWCAVSRESDESKLVDAIKAGNDPMKSELPSPENPQVVDIGALQVSAPGFLGGGECFPDKTFSVMGSSFTLPVSQVCGPLLALRYAIMLIAALAAWRMVSGVILQT